MVLGVVNIIISTFYFKIYLIYLFFFPKSEHHNIICIVKSPPLRLKWSRGIYYRLCSNLVHGLQALNNLVFFFIFERI